MKIINADVFDEIIFKNIEDVDTNIVTGITSTLILPTGNLNNILINFNFINKKLCEDLKIIANFDIDKKVCIDVPLQSFNINGRTFENACFIPAEVFLDPCNFYLGLYGFSLDGENIKQRISLIPLKNIVVKGSYDPDAKEGIIPTPTVFEMYFNEVAEANNKLDEMINAKTMYYKKYETNYTANFGETEIPTGIVNFSTLFSLIVDKNGLVLKQGEEYTIDYENNKIILTNAVEVNGTAFHFIGFATIIGTAKDMSDFINGDVVVADSIEWDKILNKPTTYNPPIATANTLGGIKVGANLEITNDGTLNATGGGGTADSVEWDGILNKPEKFTPTDHTHTTSEVTDLKVPTKTSDLTNDSSYATESFVTNAIANAQLGGDSGEIDLSGYATKDDLNTKVDKITGKSLIADTEIERLSKVTNYDDTDIKNTLNSKANTSDIPTKTSQLTNDSGFLTEHQDISNLATKDELHSHGNKSILDSITQTSITSWNSKSDFSGNYEDLTNKPTINGVEVAGSMTSSDLGIEEVPTHVKSISESDITNWNNKQDKLTAGSNITIENNVISATGGGGEVNDVYSYEEQEVGTWIDGKTLYRKVVRITDLPSKANTNKDVQIGGLYKDYNFISIRGVLRGTWGTYTLPFANQDASYVVVYPVASGDNADTSPLTLRLKASYVLSTSFSECFAILEYTKNT